MANNNYRATAANILSSLGVRGVASIGGSASALKIPILGSDGKLHSSLIPIQEIIDLLLTIGFPTIDNTAFVNPASTASSETGSITAPFKSLDSAAASDKKFSNFLLLPGIASQYGNSHPVFKTEESIIRIFSLGTAQFSSLSIECATAETSFQFYNISTVGALYFIMPLNCSVSLDGVGSFGTVKGKSDSDVDPSNVSNLLYGPNISIGSIVNIQNVDFLAHSDRIKNVSTIVSGKTEKDAIDTLGRRRIRIPKFTADETGIHASISEDIPVEIDSSDSSYSDYEFHNIRGLGETLVAAANATFYKKGDSPEFSDILANVITTNKLNATGIDTLSVRFGNVPVYIDLNDFLVIGDTDSSESHAYPVIDNADTIVYPNTGDSAEY